MPRAGIHLSSVTYWKPDCAESKSNSMITASTSVTSVPAKSISAGRRPGSSAPASAKASGANRTTVSGMATGQLAEIRK
jgi:hypothetical protein